MLRRVTYLLSSTSYKEESEEREESVEEEETALQWHEFMSE